MTRILVISDTHSLHGMVPQLPEADIFIHGGDFCSTGRSFDEIRSFNTWLDTVPVPKDRRLIVSGNHDIAFDETHLYSDKQTAARARSMITNGVYLQDEFVGVNGIKIYLSPWSPRFFNWGFNVDRGEDIAKIWAKIPDETEVLVTHGPPYGVLDQIVPGEETALKGHHLGCEELTKRIKQLKNLKYHIFGHIHGSRGQMIYRFENKILDPVFTNASFLDERYRPHSGPGYFMLEV